MAINDIETKHVEMACAEFDRIGREDFLRAYGFGRAKTYELVHDGKRYDSKAILGVAHQFAKPELGPLKAQQFSGGVDAAVRWLEHLGYEVAKSDVPTRNPNWTRDEIILALDFYLRHREKIPGKQSSEIFELADQVRSVARMAGLSGDETFRNPNGVYMKLMNLRGADSDYEGTGLSQVSNLEKEVWKIPQPSLSAAASAIRDRLRPYEPQSHPPETKDPSFVATAGGRVLAATDFDSAYDTFRRLVEVASGHPFEGFDDGLVAAWESYKPRLRERAFEILGTADWAEAEIGTGKILTRTINAIEIQDTRRNLSNNLVFWQNRFGHANRDHRILLEATDSRETRWKIEELLFGLFRNSQSEGPIFDQLAEWSGGKYPLIAYLFFLKDIDRFMPIQPTGFDRAFSMLGVEFRTLRQCSWDNYISYNAVLNGLRPLLGHATGLSSVRLVDAHSFVWVLHSLSKRENNGELQPQADRTNSGRVVGGRERSIIEMRTSVQNTVRNSSGETVERRLKHKELRMSSSELEQLIAIQLDRQEDRCALTGIPFEFPGRSSDSNVYPSLDRIDSSGHYEVGNVQIVCRFINFWKGATEDEEFRRLLMLVRGQEV